MGLCPPAVTAAALFTALTVIDILTKKYNELSYDILGGFFCVLALYVICERIGDFAGWMLLGIPIIFIVFSSIIAWIESLNAKPVSVDKCPQQEQQQLPCCEDDCDPLSDLIPPMPPHLPGVSPFPRPTPTPGPTPAPAPRPGPTPTPGPGPSPVPESTPAPIGGPTATVTPTTPKPDGAPTTCLPPPVNANWWWGR